MIKHEIVLYIEMDETTNFTSYMRIMKHSYWLIQHEYVS